MKYSNIKAFEKHLKEASPNHFSTLYLLIGKDECERNEAENLTLNALLGNSPREHSLSGFDGETLSIDKVMEELSSLSFLSPKRAICLRRADALNKAATSRLEDYFDSPNPLHFLLISAASINRTTKFYKKAEKTGIVLDIEEGKPWEKETNLINKILERIKKSDKTMPPETAQYLIQHAGSDLAILYSEIDKLLCYAADKTTLSSSDIAAICTKGSAETGWQLGDAVFQRNAREALRITASLLQEGTPIFALLRQLRTQFQNKFHIASILSQGGGPEDIQKTFPYMKGKILQQNIQLALNYGTDSLKRGILLIDEAELLAKNSSLDVELLAQRLIIKLSG